MRTPIALVALSLGLGACGDPEPATVDKPTPPDMSALVRVYDAPDGVLNEQTAAQALDVSRKLADDIEQLGVDETLLDTVLEAADAKLNGETEIDGSLGTHRSAATEGDGYLLATRICNGWGPEPAPDPVNGKIELTLGFTEAGLDPVIWGALTSCQYVHEERQVLLRGLADDPAGNVRLSFGEPVPFEGVSRARILIDLDIGAEVDQTKINADFDFRIDPQTMTLETRIPTGSGDLIAIVAGDSFAGVRAQNGDFTCDQAARSCSAGDVTVAF